MIFIDFFCGDSHIIFRFPSQTHSAPPPKKNTWDEGTMIQIQGRAGPFMKGIFENELKTYQVQFDKAIGVWEPLKNHQNIPNIHLKLVVF